jgi:transketolase
MAEITQHQDTRRVFIDTLIELAEKDDRIVLITPDVGFNYLEKFQQKFPQRFFNFGVTEQSTVAIAAGMALAGMRPFVYSMINFVLFRPAEMVRNSVVCHNAPVVLLGVKGSSSYKFLGFSHNLLHDKEDINFCDNIGLSWHIPTSNFGVATAVNGAYFSNKPAYIRL